MALTSFKVAVTLLPCTLLIGVGAGVLAHQQYPGRTTTKQSLADDRAKAANKAYEMLFDRSRRGEAALPDCEAVYQWSRRLLEAALDASMNANGRRAAYRQHLERMKELRDRYRKWSAISPMPFHQTAAEYFVVEAEYWIAREASE